MAAVFVTIYIPDIRGRSLFNGFLSALTKALVKVINDDEIASGVWVKRWEGGGRGEAAIQPRTPLRGALLIAIVV